MQETTAFIERIRRINSDYQHLELAVDETLHNIKAGQSLLARPQQDDRYTWSPYLRERWWPVALTGNHRLLIEVPLSDDYTPGQPFSILGPIGKPYRFRRSLRNVLLIAYDTPPTPLLMMIYNLLKNSVSVTMVLLGTARAYNTGHLMPELEVVHGDDALNWADQVMTLGWADQVFLTVPAGDDRQHFRTIYNVIESRRSDISKNYLFGVFAPLTPCGMGGCHACMITVENKPFLTCTEGPAVDLTLVKLPT